MADLFSKVLNMSLTASVVILFVMAARLALRKAPKIYSYALWAVVLFRLLCPVSLMSSVSVLEVAKPQVTESVGITSTVSYLPAETRQDTLPMASTAKDADTLAAETTATESKQAKLDWRTAASWVWLAGIVVMALYSAVTYLRLHRTLIGAVRLKNNIYLADHIDTAFVVGVLFPKIYLPSGTPMAERRYVIAHERHHIRRCDHVIKLLAYGALCIHWFNPLAWAAFILAGKDMEMSCDEAVIRKLGEHIRADYSQSLLNLAAHRSTIAGTPLAFGEGDTKGRVMNMAKWKKPKIWVSILCAIACIVIAALCALNPAETDGEAVIGNFHIILPEDFRAQNKDGSLVIKKGSREVGGVNQLEYPDFDLDESRQNSWRWVEALDVPENVPEERFMMMVSNGTHLSATYGKGGVTETIHYFYTAEESIYDLWFDVREVTEEEQETLLEAVQVEEIPASERSQSIQAQNAGGFRGSQGEWTEIAAVFNGNNITYGGLTLTLPEEYTYRKEENGSLILSKDGVDVGGITHWNTPALQLVQPSESLEDANLEQWVSALGIPEAQEAWQQNAVRQAGETLEEPIAFMIEGGGDYLSAWYSNELYPEKLNREHDLFISGNVVYDIWHDENVITDEEAGKYLKTVLIDGEPTVLTASEQTPTVDGSVIIIDAELVQYGSLKLLLPTGFAAVEQNGVMFLSKASVEVGGIMQWKYPDFQPSDIVELKKNELGVPIGYMSSSSAYGDMEYEVFWDGNPDGLNEQHTFFIDGDIIYDVWYDQNLISAGIAERFLKTVAINADPVVEEKPDEQAAFAKCRAVLDAVQKGSYKVVTRQTNGRDENAMSHERTYSRSGDDWLSITNVLPVGEDFTGEVEYATTSSTLCVNGKHFRYTGTEWVEIAEIENARIPWLADFTWDENIVAYMDTLTDEDGECVMLRVDEKYIDSDEYDPHYFLYFNFDPDGNFVNAQLQVNLFRDNELAITESIVTLDSETVAAEIDRQYQRAIG